MSLSNTSTTMDAPTSASQALVTMPTSTTAVARMTPSHAAKRDLCNILAAKVGTYLKQPKDFMMHVVVTDYYSEINATPGGEIIQQLVYGFSHAKGAFIKLIETDDRGRLISWTPSLKEVDPGMFVFHLGVPLLPEYNNVIINVNKRTFECLDYLDSIPEEFDISISFKDTDVFTRGDE
jgi:hypothetical protein